MLINIYLKLNNCKNIDKNKNKDKFYLKMIDKNYYYKLFLTIFCIFIIFNIDYFSYKKFYIKYSCFNISNDIILIKPITLILIPS